MSDTYGTNLNRKFATSVLKIFYEKSVADMICNRDYEGEIKGVATKVDVLTFQAQAWQSYTGAALTATDIYEVACQLHTDQQKAYYVKIKSIDQLKSWVKDPQGTIVEQLGNQLKQDVDAFVLAKYADVAAGNRVGTDYTTGTVTITAVSGAVVGDGTTFTSAMVGRGFKAAGHSVWYRVKSQSSGTAIVIEDDKDDVTSAYTGGAINAGATYTIEAATVLECNSNGGSSKTKIVGLVASLKGKLDKALVPDDGNRWLVIPSDVEIALINADQLNKSIDGVYRDLIGRGFIGELFGFKIFRTEQVSGNNTDGYRVLAGHTAWQTFAEALVENGEEPWLAGDFGKAVKGLVVYGSKIADERRKCAAEAFIKIVSE